MAASKRQDMDRVSPKRANRNEGEGSRSAAKAYNEATRKFVSEGKPASAAREAAKALSSPEAQGLIAAEAKGRARARR
mgnify:CR=1 FL=1